MLGRAAVRETSEGAPHGYRGEDPDPRRARQPALRVHHGLRAVAGTAQGSDGRAGAPHTGPRRRPVGRFHAPRPRVGGGPVGSFVRPRVDCRAAARWRRGAPAHVEHAGVESRSSRTCSRRRGAWSTCSRPRTPRSAWLGSSYSSSARSAACSRSFDHGPRDVLRPRVQVHFPGRPPNRHPRCVFSPWWNRQRRARLSRLVDPPSPNGTM